MRVLIVAGLLLSLIVVAVSIEHSLDSLTPKFDPKSAIGELETGCTVEFIRPTVLMTASHCIGKPFLWFMLPGEPGQVMKVYFTDPNDGRKIELDATVVWSSAWDKAYEEDGLDLAFLTVKDPWPYVLEFRKEPLKKFPSEGRNISMALGIQYWDVMLDISGYFELGGLGKVLIYRGDSGPGSSGSVVLVDGKIVGMITHGTRNGLMIPVLHVGSTAERIIKALVDYDRKGKMVECGDKKQSKICRVK